MSKKPQGAMLQSINGIGGAALSSLDSLAVIQECVALFRTVEEERTKRIQIEARRDAFVAAIDAERDVILAYFNYRFAERRISLDQFFRALNEGVVNKDVSIIDSSITGILGILQDNPLKDLAEFKKNMNREDFTLEL